MFSEVDVQLSEAGVAAPALVVIPAGVGSLAQAASSTTAACGMHGATALLTVEPGTAACVLASLVRGKLGTIGTSETIMAGLTCGTPSMLAWPYLRDGLDAAVAVADADSATAARDLAGYGIPAGPCGAASLAGAPRRAHRGGRGGTAGLGRHPPGRDGGAAEHRRICGQPGTGELIVPDQGPTVSGPGGCGRSHPRPRPVRPRR